MLYIFTPTFNRGYRLSYLYDSLCNQTNKNFIWLIVDDGSEDSTKEIVSNYIKENKVSIVYLYKRNGGKHSAYNLAMRYMQPSDYHVCVDSDDWLLEDAVEIIFKDLESLTLSNRYVGLVYPRYSLNQGNNWLNPKILEVNIPDLKYKYHLKIETCIVINDAYLVDFEFPCFEGENFLSEEIMYIYLSKKGYFCPQNRKIYCFDYLEDGLTSNIFKLWRKNFKGTIFSLENSYMYVMSFPNIFDRWWSAIKIKMNIQALKMTTLGVIPTLKSEEAGWKILLGFSYLWKVARFKKSE